MEGLSKREVDRFNELKEVCSILMYLEEVGNDVGRQLEDFERSWCVPEACTPHVF